MPPVPNAKDFENYADLAAAQIEGEDYRVVVLARPTSKVAIVAPHGGAIEFQTSEIARELAGDEFNLYLFEGIRKSNNYRALHLTSHLFDEPRCLKTLATCWRVVTIHGCSLKGQRVLIGGRDEPLKGAVCEALVAAGIQGDIAGHAFPASHPDNICNRGVTGKGVQLELTSALRRSPGQIEAFIKSVRSVLLA